jgi:beta-lactamase class A
MLRDQIDRIAEEAGAEEVSLSVYDYAGDTAWSLRGTRTYHAASTIKVAVLLALFDAIDRDEYPATGVLHVRNRFRSVVDGTVYAIDSGRDANSAVFAARGKTLPLMELARHMVQTSSNLATNLLVDLLGPETIQDVLRSHDVRGVDVLRGVEDDAAWEAGINNTVTADGLVRLFRVVNDETLSKSSTEAMREILLGQEFRQGIPRGLPDDVRADAEIAHKTGEISTVAHDAGIVTLRDRAPYVLAILTEWQPDVSVSGRHEALAAISREVYQFIISADG